MRVLRKILIFWKFRNFKRNYSESRKLMSWIKTHSTRSSVRKLGWRFTAKLPNTEPRSIGSARLPRTFVNFVVAFVFLTKFYITVTSFVLLTLKISYWSLIFGDYQRPSSIKPWWTTRLWVFQNDENMMKTLKILKNIRKSISIPKFWIEYTRWRLSMTKLSYFALDKTLISNSFRASISKNVETMMKILKVSGRISGNSFSLRNSELN